MIKECPIHITPTAIQAVKDIFAQKNVPQEYGLRIGIKGAAGGCGAVVQHIIGFDKAEEKDAIFNVDGIKVFINRGHFLYLAGMAVDYKNDYEATGFVFEKES